MKRIILAIILFSLILIFALLSCFLFTDKTKEDFENEKDEITSNVYIAMITVPAITNFDMGYTGVATPVHTVPSISSFRMGKYEVTYEQWYAVRQYAI